MDVAEGGAATSHRVTLSAVPPRAARPRRDRSGRPRSALIRKFLLERESKESILRSFDLTVIGRYFPEWEQRMQRSR